MDLRRSSLVRVAALLVAAGPLRAQLGFEGGLGVSGGFGTPVVGNPEPMPSAPSTAAYLVHRGAAFAAERVVLQRGERATLRVLGDGLADPRPELLRVRFTLADGSELELEARPDGQDYIVPVEADRISAGVPGGGVAVFRTRASEDARTFAAEVPAVRARAGIRADLLQMVDEADPRALRDGTRDYSGPDVVDAGGALMVPFTATDPAGNRVAKGAVALAQRAEWMLLSGHYPIADGIDVLGTQVDPESVAGARWPGHLRVLILASCYAGEVGGYAPAGDMQSGRGIDGARWWRKFRGTLLAYRGSAPTGAAPAITRRFLAAVGRIQVSPEDRDAHSTALAKAWLQANAASQATYAVAIDSRGRYHHLGRTEAPLPGAERLGRQVTRAPEEAWGPLVDQLEVRHQVERTVLAALDSHLVEAHGGLPLVGPEEALALPAVRQQAQESGFQPDDPRLVQTVRLHLQYQAHLVYEVPDLLRTSRLVAHLRRTEGGAVDLDRVVAALTPPADLHLRLGAPRPWVPRLLPRATLEALAGPPRSGGSLPQ